ncbi:hypothetical protein J3459_010776 [Metarhizium acridum]|uniref:uncharacterized protein n=1 Tax=Metarhizium acridum TaxID=92637 RepID=UPI001C6C41C4|nr:hypothetical protein J3458_019993 [Metarhizium acridum]KAG8422017.1 hypothetical protein J3459_010776 [Metarhizium acridum]
MKEITSAGGNISVFGIPMSVGGGGSRTDERNSHTATWDNASKTLKVVPGPDVGFATVGGVVGDKSDILQGEFSHKWMKRSPGAILKVTNHG